MLAEARASGCAGKQAAGEELRPNRVKITGALKHTREQYRHIYLNFNHFGRVARLIAISDTKNGTKNTESIF